MYLGCINERIGIMLSMRATHSELNYTEREQLDKGTRCQGTLRVGVMRNITEGKTVGGFIFVVNF
jgi:hypothetical protein